MVPKIVLVLLPLAAYGACLGVAAARGRLPARQSVNVQTSLLLMTYLLATASLGIFWVANQQLPVFDWHYLFGYCTVLLVTMHLCFNLPLALRLLRGPRRARRRAGRQAGARGKVLLRRRGAGRRIFPRHAPARERRLAAVGRGAGSRRQGRSPR